MKRNHIYKLAASHSLVQLSCTLIFEVRRQIKPVGKYHRFFFFGHRCQSYFFSRALVSAIGYVIDIVTINAVLLLLGVYTLEEVALVSKQRMIKLQSLYLKQFNQLRRQLQEKRRQFLSDESITHSKQARMLITVCIYLFRSR